MHRSRKHRTGDPGEAKRRKAANGEGFTSKTGYRMIGDKFEHRIVMEQILGRPLLRKEVVHHKNGVRDDNRPENLELWTKAQPAGQRVEDKLEFAREMLALYGDRDERAAYDNFLPNAVAAAA